MSDKIKLIKCTVDVNKGLVNHSQPFSKDREWPLIKRLLLVSNKDKVIKIQSQMVYSHITQTQHHSNSIYSYYILETSKYFNIFNELFYCRQLQSNLFQMYDHMIKIIEDNKDTVEIR